MAKLMIYVMGWDEPIESYVPWGVSSSSFEKHITDLGTKGYLHHSMRYYPPGRIRYIDVVE